MTHIRNAQKLVLQKWTYNKKVDVSVVRVRFKILCSNSSLSFPPTALSKSILRLSKDMEKSFLRVMQVEKI